MTATFYFDATGGGVELPRFEATDLARRNVRWALFRHVRAPSAPSATSWLLHDGTYTSSAPADPTTIAMTFSAARTPIQARDAAALLAAGQTIVLPDGTTSWRASDGLTWAQVGQLAWSDLTYFPWSDL